MKKLILLVLLVLTVSGLYAQTSPEWKWIHPKPQGQYLRWVQAIDANNWVAGGDYGQFLKSTNAGTTWVTSTGGYPSTLYPGAQIYQNLLCAQFFNANTGYIGVQSVRGIAKTTNGGQTFDTLQIIPSGSGSANAMYFLNQQTGFVAGSSVFKVQRTTNGGANWMMMPNLGTSTLSAIYAWDTANVIIGGSTSGKLYKTSTSGAVWDTVILGVTNSIYNIKFVNSTTGYLTGSSGLFRFTTNGGVNWAGVNPATTASLYSIAVSGSDIYVSGYTSATQDLFKTTDGGDNWTQSTLAATNPGGIMSADMVNANTGFVTINSSNKPVYKTIDGGLNWTPYTTGITGLLYDIKAVDTNIVYVVTSAGTNRVGKSTNGGVNWTLMPVPVAADYRSVDFKDANTGYICGNGTTIVCRTTNGGTTWSFQNVHIVTTGKVHVTAGDTAFVNGGYTSILRAPGSTLTGVEYNGNVIPKGYELKQNYPNPFNPTTTIEFNLPKAGNVSIKVFDIAGREYTTDINNMNLNAGNFKMSFNGSELSTGIYFYSLVVDGVNLAAKKLVLIK